MQEAPDNVISSFAEMLYLMKCSTQHMYTVTDPSVDQVLALTNTPKQSGGGLGGQASDGSHTIVTNKQTNMYTFFLQRA